MENNKNIPRCTEPILQTGPESEPTLEERINQAVKEALSSDTIEKAVTAAVTEALNKTAAAAWGYNSPAYKALEDKMKNMFLPSVERLDLARQAEKLDAILTEAVIMAGAGATADMLDRLKNVLVPELPENGIISTSDLFTKYAEYVRKTVSNEEDNVSEFAEIRMNLTDDEDFGGNITDAMLCFFCEDIEDDSVQHTVHLYRTKGTDPEWNIMRPGFTSDITSLRYADSFLLYLQMLYQHNIKITVDEGYLSEPFDNEGC